MALKDNIRRTGSLAGFTLLEVAVSIAILGVVMVAVFGSVNRVTSNAFYLQNKLFADWVAMNKITELRLLPQWPDTGKSNGEVEMAGLEWHWDVEVKETPVDGLRRIDVTVSTTDNQEQSLAYVSGFVAQPGQLQAGTPWIGAGQAGQNDPGAPQPGSPEDEQR